MRTHTAHSRIHVLLLLLFVYVGLAGPGAWRSSVIETELAGRTGQLELMQSSAVYSGFLDTKDLLWSHRRLDDGGGGCGRCGSRCRTVSARFNKLCASYTWLNGYITILSAHDSLKQVQTYTHKLECTTLYTH